MPEKTGKNAISIENINFSYGNLKVIDDLSLNIPAGTSFGLLGANGAGKTTLIRHIVGLLQPKTGSVNVLGHKPSRQRSNLIGYMPQLQSLYNELSVWENVDFFAHISGINDRQERARRTEETIRLVELWPRRKDPVFNLSGGMKQRVSLACAIVHRPPLLVLDEPTVGLDPALRANFWEHFNSLIKQGVTLIISSHTMDDAAHCQQLAFMRDGKVIAIGTPEELKIATGNPSCSLEDAFLYQIRQKEEAKNA